MTITQRDTIDGVLVDVICTGRFFDFLIRSEGTWKLVRRQPIYEPDRLDAVEPGANLELDQELLRSFPVGYQHLGYLQTKAGFDVERGLPGLTGEAVDRLYRLGDAWLAGAAGGTPGVEHGELVGPLPHQRSLPRLP